MHGPFLSLIRKIINWSSSLLEFFLFCFLKLHRRLGMRKNGLNESGQTCQGLNLASVFFFRKLGAIKLMSHCSSLLILLFYQLLMHPYPMVVSEDIVQFTSSTFGFQSQQSTACYSGGEGSLADMGMKQQSGFQQPPVELQQQRFFHATASTSYLL